MALCCYSRATNASGLTQTTQWSSRDYRGAPLTSTQQHAQGPQERSGITGQEQSPQFGLHSNHQTNSVPGDVLIGLLTNYGPEDSFMPCFRPSSSVTYFSLLANPEQQPLHAQQLRIPRLSGTISVSSLLRPSATPHFQLPYYGPSDPRTGSSCHSLLRI